MYRNHAYIAFMYLRFKSELIEINEDLKSLTKTDQEKNNKLSSCSPNTYFNQYFIVRKAMKYGA